MDIRDLKYISAVVRTRNFGRAAQDLGVTQPAVTKAVQRLEREFDTLLLSRTSKGVVPTDAGLALLKRVRQIEEAVETTQREMSDLAKGSAGHVRIGAGSAMLAQMLPQACSTLLNSLPGITFRIVGDMNDNLFKALRNGDLDLVVSGLPLVAPDDLVQQPLLKDELTIATRETHPLSQRRNCSFEDLARLRWALPPRPVFSRELLDRSFREHGFSPPSTVIESNSAQLLLETVSRSDLATFQPVSNLHAASHLKLCQMKPTGVRWMRTIGISYRQSGYLPPVALKVIELLRSTVSPGRGEAPPTK